MYVLANMWFQKLMRQFFFGIDKIVYSFISSIYNLLISIARTSILSQADIIDMTSKIYKLLAVFMVFKVTFSLIMYVVNPDDFSDKSKGAGKLVTNIVISLSLLILTPYIFSYAYQLQTIILEDNSLATLIFGTEKGDISGEDSSFLNDAGDKMAFITMSPFFAPDISIEELYDCTVLVENNSNGSLSFNDSCKKGMINLIGENNDYMVENYTTGIEVSNLGLMFRQDLAIATDSNGDNFIIDYKWGFSTVIGVVIVLLLITFCMDVAIRSIKLAFYQLIAPIPILSYVDPKSGKDGMFKKWYQACFKTFLSLFVRLLALYFALYIISRINSFTDIIDGTTQSNMLIKIFIIIGALMFAKQLPKILEGLGIKLDGGFNLNPLRRIEKEALGGKYLKKPNDMLAKGAKAIIKSPLSGASLLGKKTIGAIDAAKHGKGLKRGWKRVHGKLHNNFYKKLDEWAPDSAEARKNERLGKEEVNQMHNKWSKGKQIFDNMANSFPNATMKDGKLVKNPFDLLDGTNSSAYEAAGFKGNFLQSKMNLDYASERQKILSNINSAMMRGLEFEDAFYAQGIDKLKKYGFINSKGEKIIESEDVDRELDKINKQVSGLEKVHESIRKQDAYQAKIEDAIKFVKYNPIDPTDPTDQKRRIVIEKTNSNQPGNNGNTQRPMNTSNNSSSNQTNDNVPHSDFVVAPSYTGNMFKEEEERKTEKLTREEVERQNAEIDKRMNQQQNLTDDLNERVESLRKALQQLIEAKNNPSNKSEIDEINKDIEKIKSELEKILSKNE